MRTTVTLDDALLAKAAEYSGVSETSALINHALKRLIQSEAARRLAELGGSMPDFEPGRRNRVRGFEEEGEE
jgi:Arc/MetJ family transcription regulator